jgi:hypothetical protein
MGAAPKSMAPDRWALASGWAAGMHDDRLRAVGLDARQAVEMQPFRPGVLRSQ